MNLRLNVPVERIKHAEFEFWKPTGKLTNELNGILVLVPPSNADGRCMLQYVSWQDFARENHLAMIGCYFRDGEIGVAEQYADAKQESGPALLRAIETWNLTNPGLTKLKLYLWGFSAGGQFAYEFNAYRPDKVGAFVTNKGGIYYTALCSKEARENPGLLIYGKEDVPHRVNTIRGIYSVNKYVGADWILAGDPCGHTEGNSARWGRQFIEKIISAQEEAK